MGALERPFKSRRLIWPLALLGLFGFNLLLYATMLGDLDSPYRGSISAGYVGIARFIADHPNPWGWNPQQYGGLPTQFSYPPVVPYLTALLMWGSGLEAVAAYRMVTGVLASLGPLSLAFAFAFLTGSRSLALLLGIAYSIFSPSYGLFELVDKDRGLFYLPWRLLVMLKYGEGPHVVGLTLLPLQIAVLVWGARRRDWRSLLLMAFALALAPLTNWLCAFSLTLAVLLLCLSDWGLSRRIFLAGIWGYGLACFWLTPDYILTTAFNWPKDSYGYRVEQAHWPMYAGLLALLVAARWAMARLRIEFGLRFLTLAALCFGWIASGFYIYNRDTIPESRRYSLEFELFALAATAGWMMVGLRSRERVDRGCAVLCALFLVLAGFGDLRSTLLRRYEDWGFMDRRSTIEYQITEWLNAQKPHGRIFATGSLRFRLNAFSSAPQIGGTFESGLKNRYAVDVHYQVRTGESSRPGEEALDAESQLNVLGTQYVVVHGPQSQEYYRDVKNPDKFASFARIAHQPTVHDTVYELSNPRLAWSVRPAEMPPDANKVQIRRLSAAAKDPTRPRLLWIEEHPGRYRIEGSLRAGDEVFVAMNYDRGWRAWQGSEPLNVGRNALGMIQLQPRGGHTAYLLLEYQGTREQKVCAALSALLWIGSIALWFRRKASTEKNSTL